jgi:Fe-Mn family superoxide dismutase
MIMSFEMPKLPYATNALEPFISAKTIEFHYGKHHQAYLTKLNGMIPGTQFENATLEDIVSQATGGVFNNGAQVWNHTFYWESFSAKRNTVPSGDLLALIERDFGTFEEFKAKFTDAAINLFGAGWTWFTMKPDNSLVIVQTGNAGNPLREGQVPLLTCDVWEHAYYLDYQNRRPDYLEAFWNLVDWDIVASRLP